MNGPWDGPRDAGGMLKQMLGGCSGDARECPGNASQDAPGMLPRMLGRCSPRCSGDARGMLGKCSPAYSGDAREMLTGRLREGARGCSGDARRDVRRCSGVRPACSPRHSGAALGCARGMMPVMLLRCCPGCSGGARGCSPPCWEMSAGCPGAAVGPVRRCPSGCAPRAELNGAAGPEGGRQRGGEGVASPARLSRRPGSINEIIMQIEQPCATRLPYLIPGGGEAGQGEGGGMPGPPPRGDWHRVGSATKAGTAGSRCHIRQPDTKGGHCRWAHRDCRNTPLPPPMRFLSTSGCPSRPSRSDAMGWATDVAWEAPGEREWAWGWHREGGMLTQTHSHTHTNVREY